MLDCLVEHLIECWTDVFAVCMSQLIEPCLRQTTAEEIDNFVLRSVSNFLHLLVSRSTLFLPVLPQFARVKSGQLAIPRGSQHGTDQLLFKPIPVRIFEPKLQKGVHKNVWVLRVQSQVG